MKRLLALLIVAAMVIVLVPAFTIAVSADGAIEIGTAAELKDFIAKINDGTYAADTCAKLTADIELNIESVNYENWSPITILDYKGTIDGNGYTISGLSFTRYLENGGVQADPEKYNDLGGGAANLFCFGQISFAAFIYNFSGTLKNITFDDVDVTLLIHNTNRNYRTDVAGIVGRALSGATFENVTLKDVDVAANDRVNCNQGNIGGAAALIGRAQNGTVTIKDCTIDGDSSVNTADTSTVTMPVSGTSCTMINGRLEVGAFVGCVENATLRISDTSASEAALSELAPDAVWNPPGNKFYEGRDGQQAGPINTNRVDGTAGEIYGAKDEASTVTVFTDSDPEPEPDPVPTPVDALFGTWTRTGDDYQMTDRPGGNDFGYVQLGESDNVTLSADVKLGEEFGYFFGVEDRNGDGKITEGGDGYYLIDFKVDGNATVIGIERNNGGWGGWKTRFNTGKAVGDTVTVKVEYNKGTFVVYVDDAEIGRFSDGNYFTSTGYGLCSKSTSADAAFKNVAVAENGVEPIEIGAGSAVEGDNYGDWTVVEGVYTSTKEKDGNNFNAYVLGNTEKGEKVTVTATVDVTGGPELGFLLAISDTASDKKIQEGDDYYYLIDFMSDGKVGIEKNQKGWNDWAVISDGRVIPEGAETAELSVTLDNGTITVSVNDEIVLRYVDPNPLVGTGYAIATKTAGKAFSNVTAVVGNPTTPDHTPASTGDVAAIAIAAVAVMSLAGVAVVASKRRKIED